MPKPIAELTDVKEVRERANAAWTRIDELRKKDTGEYQWTAEDENSWKEANSDYDAASTRETELRKAAEKAANDVNEGRQSRSRRFRDIETVRRRGEGFGRDDFDGDRREHNPRAAVTRQDFFRATAAWFRAGNPKQRAKLSDADKQALRTCRFDRNSLAANELEFRLRDSLQMQERQLGWHCNGRKAQPPRRNSREERGMSVGVDADGGYTVPDEMLRRLEMAIEHLGGPRDVATILRTETGNLLNMPTFDDTANEGEQLDELTDFGDEDDPAFGTVGWGAYKYSSKPQPISFELLQDSPFALVQVLVDALGGRIARIQRKRFTTGTGTGQPQGMVTGANLGVTAASTTAITADELLDLIHSVAPEYRNDRSGWMFNDSILLKIRKLKYSGSGEYVFQRGGMGSPDLIWDYPYTINQQMATAAAGAKTVLFGDFSTYWIRDAGTLRVVRMNELYAAKDAVGFCCFLRSDGRYMKSNAVKRLQQAAS